MEPDEDRVLFTACRTVVQAAIAQVASCEACNSDADWPFECILDLVMLFSGVHTDYIMPEPPALPTMPSNSDRGDARRMGMVDEVRFAEACAVIDRA
jgi:hypothetical protein